VRVCVCVYIYIYVHKYYSDCLDHIMCSICMNWSRLKQAHRIGIDPLNVEIDVIIQGWGLQVKHTHTHTHIKGLVWVSECVCVCVCLCMYEFCLWNATKAPPPTHAPFFEQTHTHYSQNTYTQCTHSHSQIRTSARADTYT